MESLTDEELNELYYSLRDVKVPFDGGWFYPNIQVIFGTPFEREKDRREIRRIVSKTDREESEVVDWYSKAKDKSCVWWVENHMLARHSLTSCMSCGACTSLCPASELYDFSPRKIMEIVQDKDEEQLVALLKSETIWYCHQCASCKPKCPRGNSPFTLISSLRQLCQLKKFHLGTVRGRQQYAARHLWGGNLWNRACTLYFRNSHPESHRDFGPRFEEIYNRQTEHYRQVGVCPDMDGSLSARKVHPDTLAEVRKIWELSGALYFWDMIEQAGQEQADKWNMDIDEYHDKVRSEG
ncbi:MAG: 4Fe-4S dicluster domain-containing protein [Spirochaetes bacterium]|nr:4Fe-4S dicluster domain-containing protein [Spirochaetota bacterium]